MPLLSLAGGRSTGYKRTFDWLAGAATRLIATNRVFFNIGASSLSMGSLVSLDMLVLLLGPAPAHSRSFDRNVRGNSVGWCRLSDSHGEVATPTPGCMPSGAMWPPEDQARSAPGYSTVAAEIVSITTDMVCAYAIAGPSSAYGITRAPSAL